MAGLYRPIPREKGRIGLLSVRPGEKHMIGAESDVNDRLVIVFAQDD